MHTQRRFRVVCFAIGLGLTSLFGACGSGSSSASGFEVHYAHPTPTYDACTTIPDNSPIVANGVATAFAVAPTLPSGLAIDPNTGVISGTPTQSIATTDFTVSAASASGTAHCTVRIRVRTSAPHGLTYSASPATLVQGFDALGLTPSLASGTADSFSIVSGTLPAGLSLDSTTGAITGRALVRHSASVTIRAQNCEGLSTNGTLSLDVVAPKTRAAVVANGSDPVLSSFVRDPASGALRTAGWELANGSTDDVAVTCDGRFAYAASRDQNAIVAYALDAVSGRLSAPLSTTVIGGSLQRVAVDPSGRFVFASDVAHDTIHGFAIDANDGSLSALSPASVAAHSTPVSIAFDPAAHFAYVGNVGSSDVTCYTFDAATGALAFVANHSAGNGPSGLAVDPSGAYLAVVDAADAAVAVFSIQANTGVLTPVAGSPFAIASASQPIAIAFSFDGAFAYVADGNANALFEFAFDAGTGALAALNPASFDLGAHARTLAFDASGANLYAIDASGVVHVLTVAVDGSLSDANPPKLQARSGAMGLAFQPSQTDPSWHSSALYSPSHADDLIYPFSLGASDGQLFQLNQFYIASNSDEPSWVEVHPALDVAYVCNRNVGATSAVGVFDVLGDRSLTFAQGVGTSTENRSIHVDPAGKFAYLICGGALDGRIARFTIDPSDGSLSSAGADVAAGDTPEPGAFHPSGEFFYVPVSNDDLILTYRVDPSDGSLSQVDSIACGGSHPTAVCVDTCGTHLYCANEFDNSLSAFSIDATNGQLHALAQTPLTLSSSGVEIAMTPDGSRLYVGTSGGVCSEFPVDLDPTNGTEDGSLGSPTTTAMFGAVSSIRIDAAGQYLYYAGDIGWVDLYDLGVAGALSYVSSGVVGVQPGRMALFDRVQ